MVSNIIPPSNAQSAGELQAEIRRALGDGFTGIIQAALTNGKTLSVLAVNGNVRQVYLDNHRLPNMSWMNLFEPADTGRITVQPMPATGLMFRKILLERVEPLQVQSVQTIQLKTMFALAEQNNMATLFHIQWKNAQGFVLVAGGKIPIRHVVALTNDSAGEGQVALDQIYGWNEADCSVTVYRGDIKSQAWLEMHLNILFEWSCRLILSHYGQLTGIVMIQSILRALSVSAVRNGCDINTQNNNVTDATIFSNAAAAGSAYRDILAAIKRNMRPVIGSQLVESIFKDIAISARGIYGSIAEVFELF